MATYPVFEVNDNRTSADATPQNLALFEFPTNTVALLTVEVQAVRADKAAKAWSLQSFVRRNGGLLEVLETIPSPPNLFATAADAAAMSGVNIALFTDSTYVGITCTGQAGQTIDWLLRIHGRGTTI